MSKRRLVRALTSAVLTGAMIMSMGGMTAFAAVESVPLEKIIDVGNNNKDEEGNVLVVAPNADFTFALGETTDATNTEDVVSLGKDTINNTSIEVYQGVTGGAYFDKDSETNAKKYTHTMSFNPGDEFTKETVINLDKAAFPKPGVYRYEVHEVTPEMAYDGMSYSRDSYFIFVYVVRTDAGNEVDGVIVRKDGNETIVGTNKEGKITFTNNYATNKLTVTKVISGNQANMGAKFSFSITVNGASGEQFKTSNPDITLTAGTVYNNIKLGNDETITIYGLSENDTFTVVETDADTDGYVTTYKLDEDEVSAENLESVFEGKVDKAVVVTNKKDVATPTGIALSFAPYALLVVLAGAFAALFLGKKKRDEF